MKELYKKNTNCRLCKSAKIIKIVSIGDSPISEKYTSDKNINKKQDLVPLDLYLCNECFHVQLIDVVNPDYLWSDFTFKTSRNKKIENHYENYVNEIINHAAKTDIKFVVDVGSNDGTLLEIFKSKKIEKILGIDPAANIVMEANKKGIPTLAGYMNKANSQKILSQHGKADIVTANNVYAHVNDFDDLTLSIKNILNKDGIFAFEVSYLLDVIQKKLLGTIFHEHLSYHSLGPLIKYFKKHGLEIFHVVKNDLQGGSIICYSQHKGGPYKITNDLVKMVQTEEKSKLNDINTYLNFAKALEQLKNDINKLLDEVALKGKKVVGFGSARSATTFIKYFDIAKKIDFILDDNKEKHGKYTPGYPIQVLPSASLYNLNKDYVIIFAWEHSSKILSNHKKFIENGGKFINIFPKLEIISK